MKESWADERSSAFALAPGAPCAVVHLGKPTWHPIVYRKWVQRIDGAPRPGEIVELRHSETQVIGYGLYNPRSEIAVRIVRFGARPLDEAYWDGLLVRAVALRRELLRLDEVTDAYRVVHAEADGLSGLVADKLGDVLSVEVFALGMWPRAERIAQRLAELCGVRQWLIRTGPQVYSQEGFGEGEFSSPDLPARVLIHEFGTKFRVQFARSHKTGFFCDQRDNRRLLASYCRDRSVLDLCCYTGGFAVQAKKLGGAADVTAVDLDEEPLKIARENANLNQARINFAQSDAFAYMRDMLRNGRQYDVVVLDPPKLITSRRELEEGTRKHFDLNRLAMQLVKPGGLLLSCSCAGLLPEHEFLDLLYAAARQAGPEMPAPPGVKPRHEARTLQVLARTGAAADHPVSSQCPQGEYLKAVWMRLE